MFHCFQGEKGDAGAEGTTGDRGEVGLKGKEGPPGPPGLVGVRVSVLAANSKFHSVPMKKRLLWSTRTCSIFCYQGQEGKAGKPGERGRPGEKVRPFTCLKLNAPFNLGYLSIYFLPPGVQMFSAVAGSKQRGRDPHEHNAGGARQLDFYCYMFDFAKLTELTVQGCLYAH